MLLLMEHDTRLDTEIHRETTEFFRRISEMRRQVTKIYRKVGRGQHQHAMQVLICLCLQIHSAPRHHQVKELVQI